MGQRDRAAGSRDAGAPGVSICWRVSLGRDRQQINWRDSGRESVSSRVGSELYHYSTARLGANTRSDRAYCGRDNDAVPRMPPPPTADPCAGRLYCDPTRPPFLRSGLLNLTLTFLSKDVFSGKSLNRQKFIGGYRPRCHVEKQNEQEAGWPCDRFISSLKSRIVLILLLISANQVDSVGRVYKYDFNLYRVCARSRHGSIINIEN